MPNVPAKTGLYHTIHASIFLLHFEICSMALGCFDTTIHWFSLDDTTVNNDTVERSNENKTEFIAGNSTENEFTAETSHENRAGECMEKFIHSDEKRVVFKL